MQKINLTNVLKSYTKGWVSISQDYRRVLASGKTLRELLRKLKTLGNPKGYIMKAAQNYSQYIGT